MVVAAPLFGLLGTVSGMLLTFKAIGIGGSSVSEVIAKGISEALVATQTGMMVAVPGLLLAYLAKRLRNEYVAFLARLEGITLRHFRPSFPEATAESVQATKEDPGRASLPRLCRRLLMLYPHEISPHASRNRTSRRVNRIPLIDVIMFCYLFISTTGFIEEPGQVDKPQASANNWTRTAYFAVTSDGKIAYGGKKSASAACGRR